MKRVPQQPKCALLKETGLFRLFYPAALWGTGSQNEGVASFMPRSVVGAGVAFRVVLAGVSKGRIRRQRERQVRVPRPPSYEGFFLLLQSRGLAEVVTRAKRT